MLYLIGGASRAGKSKLARRLLRERQLPYLSLDILLMGIANGIPSFGHNPDESAIVRGEQMWPLVRAMAVNVVETGVDYVIEGDILLPHHIAEFTHLYSTHVRSCFIGYPTITIDQKVHDVRTKGGEANDWLEGASDAYVREIVEHNIAFSTYLRNGCTHHGLHYFDTSDNFAQALDAAFGYMTAPG